MLILRLDHEAETYAILKPEAALDELVFNEYTHLNKMSMLGLGYIELNESLTLEFYLPINGSIVEDFNRRIRSLQDLGYIDISDWFEGWYHVDNTHHTNIFTSPAVLLSGISN